MKEFQNPKISNRAGLKALFLLFAALLLAWLIVPCLALGADIGDDVKVHFNADQNAQSAPETPLAQAAPGSESAASETQTPSSEAAVSQAAETAVFHILDSMKDEVFEVDDRTFLIGTLAAELAPTYHAEALKAQAVAAYTYYCSLRNARKMTQSSALKGADFAANPSQWLIYASKEQMQERWGENFDAYYRNLCDAVDAVWGQTLQQNGELITATYYAISGGTTVDAKEVFGNARSYLVPVASPGDVYAEGFRTTLTLTPEQVHTAAKNAWDCTLEGDPNAWFGQIVRDSSGYVSSVVIGGAERKGTQARTAFGLRSANFEVAYENGAFTFSVKGYGHGVGMSQVGAQYMASQGSAYHEILAWYYPNTELVK